MNAELANPPAAEAILTIRNEDLQGLLEQAAERGAERALFHLGLESPHAAHDIRELRDLLGAWRAARSTAWHTFIRVVTTGFLAVVLIGVAIKLKFMGGGQ